MKLSEDRITTLVGQVKLPYLSYVTTSGEKIYQTNPNTNTITCYTIKGDKLWEFKDVSLLNVPRGITVDNKSKVYVTSYSSNNVVVLESDGKEGRRLSSEDKLFDSCGIYFDKSKNSLLVTNYHGPSFLYHVC